MGTRATDLLADAEEFVTVTYVGTGGIGIRFPDDIAADRGIERGDTVAILDDGERIRLVLPDK